MATESRLPVHRVGLFALLLLAAAAILFGVTRCSSNNPASFNKTNPAGYAKVVSAFSDAVYALQVCDTHRIGSVVPKLTQIYPDEPAAWANVAVMHIRVGNIPAATDALDKAHKLAPDSADIEYIHGMLEKSQYHLEPAAAHFTRAIQLDPGYLKARFALSEVLSSQGNSDAKAVEQLKAIASARPGNVVVLLEMAKLQAKMQDLSGLKDTVGRMKPLSTAWNALAREKLADLEKAITAGKVTADDARVLNYVANPSAQAQIARMELTTLDSNAKVDPIDHFIKLRNPSWQPAPPDEAVTFTEITMNAPSGKPTVAMQVALDPELLKAEADPNKLQARGEGPVAFVTLDSTGISTFVNLALPVGQRIMHKLSPSDGQVNAATVLFTDWSYHYKPDLIIAGASGLAVFRQEDNWKFTDVTAKTGLSAEVTKASYVGAWPIDIEEDSDLDILLGAKSGPPIVLQNNDDGTFKPIKPFPSISGATAFAWLDIDGDYAPDAAIVNGEGMLHVFRNMLSAHYIEWPGLEDVGKVLALAVADLNRDGVLDLAVLRADGRITRVSRKADQTGWDIVDIAVWPNAPIDGTARILAADLDNNGAADLIGTGSSGTEIWLMNAKGEAKALATPVSALNVTLADATPQGRVDLIGISRDGKPVRLVNHGTKPYNAYLPRTRAIYIPKKGDHRINTFGLGGEFRVRAGLFAVTSPVTGPQNHIGLGANATITAVEYAWNDGAMQGEFELPANQTIYTKKRLKGSCPWLFAWNGKQVEFVTDCLWGSPLGLRINAQDTAGVAETRDWVRIRGDQLQSRDGYYDLRITAELWETHFFDMVRLMTVDHPAGTEVYLDERFAIPFPQKKLYALSPPRPVTRAIDEAGRDVTDLIRVRDGRFLDTFGVGRYQGITKDHWVELDLGTVSSSARLTSTSFAAKRPSSRSSSSSSSKRPNDPATQRPILVCQGWIHPTDSSINVALAQGKHDPPRSLSLEVPDGKGGWRVAKSNLGFPLGKNKTLLFDLTELVPPGSPQKVRLRTNLEIYWDFLGVSESRPETPIRTKEIAPSVADLRYRGYSAVSPAGLSTPEIPDYNRIEQDGGVRWVDLEGYYTRFGDVRPLLQQVDDRYVVLNAGDEIRLRFPEQSPPPPGWVRDYVFVSDGWEKDGNFNTGFARTVLPLPSHDNPAYNRPPGRLSDDPIYRRHPQDWQTYHTRYVAAPNKRYVRR